MSISASWLGILKSRGRDYQGKDILASQNGGIQVLIDLEIVVREDRRVHLFDFGLVTHEKSSYCWTGWKFACFIFE